MTTKNYEKRCARLVQEACKVSYSTALRRVREHQQAHPEPMPEETRALRVVDGQETRS